MFASTILAFKDEDIFNAEKVLTLKTNLAETKEQIRQEKNNIDRIDEKISQCESTIQHLSNQLHENENQLIKIKNKILHLTLDDELQTVREELLAAKTQYDAIPKQLEVANNSLKKLQALREEANNLLTKLNIQDELNTKEFDSYNVKLEAWKKKMFDDLDIILGHPVSNVVDIAPEQKPDVYIGDENIKSNIRFYNFYLYPEWPGAFNLSIAKQFNKIVMEIVKNDINLNFDLNIAIQTLKLDLMEYFAKNKNIQDPKNKASKIISEFLQFTTTNFILSKKVGTKNIKYWLNKILDNEDYLHIERDKHDRKQLLLVRTNAKTTLLNLLNLQLYGEEFKKTIQILENKTGVGSPAMREILLTHDNGFSLLHKAVTSNKLELVEFLLECANRNLSQEPCQDYSTFLNQQTLDHKKSALHVCINYNEKIMKLLIDKGVDLNLQNDCKRTALKVVEHILHVENSESKYKVLLEMVKLLDPRRNEDKQSNEMIIDTKHQKRILSPTGFAKNKANIPFKKPKISGDNQPSTQKILSSINNNHNRRHISFPKNADVKAEQHALTISKIINQNNEKDVKPLRSIARWNKNIFTKKSVRFADAVLIESKGNIIKNNNYLHSSDSCLKTTKVEQSLQVILNPLVKTRNIKKIIALSLDFINQVSLKQFLSHLPENSFIVILSDRKPSQDEHNTKSTQLTIYKIVKELQKQIPEKFLPIRETYLTTLTKDKGSMIINKWKAEVLGWLAKEYGLAKENILYIDTNEDYIKQAKNVSHAVAMKGGCDLMTNNEVQNWLQPSRGYFSEIKRSSIL